MAADLTAGGERKCPRCASEMERGTFVTRVPGERGITTWMVGEPEYGVFGTLKTRGKKQFRIDVYRCKTCGLLECCATRPANE